MREGKDKDHAQLKKNWLIEFIVVRQNNIINIKN